MPRIHLLPPETSRLIAAGEVIERPASVLREFLDNALDAGATEVVVDLEGGGADLVRVADDGLGMGEEDLALAILPHATSKIRVADDLLTARSLGFRGEALASIAAAANLELTSREEGAEVGHRLTAGPGLAVRIDQVPARRGTVAQASRLFDSYPARKQFLKRSQAEAATCKQVFLDKAAAHPSVAFRYSSEGRLGLALRASSPEERLLGLYPELPAPLVHRVRFSGPHAAGEVVLASPAFHRTDRRLVQVFVNRRRVQDLGLQTALDYAFEGFLPGGCHPAAFLFAEVDPAWADFNIHPAKREVRFKDAASLRSSLVQAIKAFLLDLSRVAPEETRPSPARQDDLDLGGGSYATQGWGGGGSFGGGAGFRGIGLGTASHGDAGHGDAGYDRLAWSDLGGLRESLAGGAGYHGSDGLGDTDTGGKDAGEPRGGFRYLGKALGLFLVAEAGDRLYLIDQHAAHERLLYDEFMAGKPRVQDLLVPAVFEPEDEAEDRRLAGALPDLADLGFGLEREGTSWLVTSLPVPLDRDPVGSVREILESLGGATEAAPQGLGLAHREGIRSARSAALATAACRAAVKDGDELEEGAAAELARRALALPEARCPHGRPVWVELSREELFRLVRRLV